MSSTFPFGLSNRMLVSALPGMTTGPGFPVAIGGQVAAQIETTHRSGSITGDAIAKQRWAVHSLSS